MPAVADVVRKQADAGVDIPSDGEFGKTMWTQYVAERLGELSDAICRPGTPMAANSKDRQDFAEFYAIYNPISVTMWLDPVVLEHLNGAPLQSPGRWVCTQPLTYKGRQALQRDIANLKSALQGRQTSQMHFCPLLLRRALRPLYQMSTTSRTKNTSTHSQMCYARSTSRLWRQGLILQVDDAFIPYNYDRMMLQGVSMEEYRKHCEMRIDAVNHALRDIPEDHIRYHICWGSWAGPHTSDVPLSERSSTWCCASRHRPILSKRQTRATSTSGKYGETSHGCPRARS